MKNKIFSLALMCVISSPLLAAPFVQPVIQGKTYSNGEVPIRSLGKPKSIIKGNQMNVMEVIFLMNMIMAVLSF